MAEFVRRVWSRVADWFGGDAEHVTVKFLPDPDGEPIAANAGYLRVIFAEGFLAQAKSWGAKQFPALHGGVSLTVLGGPTAAFTTFAKPPETAPGAYLDYPMTTLLPFSGGAVEVQAALYEATVDGPLGTAVDLISSLATLMGPPLSAAAPLADKISDGLDKILGATGDKPVLGVHTTLVAPGGAGTVLRPGNLIVLNTPEAKLPGTPEIHDGRLHLRDGDQHHLPTGVDYLVVRIECRTERDDWRFPELDQLIRTAGESHIRGHQDAFKDHRTDAIARAWNSPDLVPTDRKRVALLVKRELDSMGELGIVPGPDQTLETIAPQRLPAADDAALRGMTLDGLLTG